jgi:hypothetical protein
MNLKMRYSSRIVFLGPPIYHLYLLLLDDPISIARKKASIPVKAINIATSRRVFPVERPKYVTTYEKTTKSAEYKRM